MERIVDAIRVATQMRAAEARLALFIVIDAIRALLREDERVELAESLPLELRVLLLGDDVSEEHNPFEDLALVDARSVEVICRLLARDAPASIQAWMARYVAPRLHHHQLGGRTTMQSTGFDALGHATLPVPETVLAASA